MKGDKVKRQMLTVIDKNEKVSFGLCISMGLAWFLHDQKLLGKFISFVHQWGREQVCEVPSSGLSVDVPRGLSPGFG